MLELQDVSFRNGGEVHIHPTSLSLSPGEIGEAIRFPSSMIRERVRVIQN